MVGVAIFMILLCVTLPLASPASAKTKEYVRHSAAAPGSATCLVTATVRFSPPLKDTGGGTNPSTIKAKLSGCTPSNDTVVIKSGKATGSFATSPYSCVTQSPTDASASLSISWKGTWSDAPTDTGPITAELIATDVSGATGTGSFTGGVSLTLPFAESVGSACSSHHGISHLTLTGTISLGTSAATVVTDSAGSFCALLTSRGVECWGDSVNGELGDGNASGPDDCAAAGRADVPCSTTPVTVQAVGGGGYLSGVTSVVGQAGGGSGSFCALLNSGGVDCWGQNDFGELGDGTSTGPESCYVPVNEASSPCSTTPVVVQAVGGGGKLSGVVSLVSDSGPDSFCALLSSGGIDCWGENSGGDLGDGSMTNSDVPMTVQAVGGGGSLSGVTNIVNENEAGSYCALLTSGGVDCWGFNVEGELGNDSTTDSDVPVTVQAVGGGGNLSGVSSLLSDDGVTFCALLNAGGVDCWGLNEWGELGDGSITGPDTCLRSFPCSTTPVTVQAVGGEGSLSGVIGILGGNPAGASFCAVLTSGGVDCWGVNESGELGDGTSSGPQTCEFESFPCSTTPVTVQAVGGGGSLTDARTGSDNAPGFCALLTTSTVACWGYNADGELGDGSTTNSDVPVTVQAVGGGGSLSGVSSIVGGGSSGSAPSSYCVVLTSGGVDCWGQNGAGRLGDGSFMSSDVPEAVIGIGS